MNVLQVFSILGYKINIVAHSTPAYFFIFGLETPGATSIHIHMWHALNPSWLSLELIRLHRTKPKNLLK